MFDMVIIIFAIGGDEKKQYVLFSPFCLPLYDLKYDDTHARKEKKKETFKASKYFQVWK